MPGKVHVRRIIISGSRWFKFRISNRLITYKYNAVVALCFDTSLLRYRSRDVSSYCQTQLPARPIKRLKTHVIIIYTRIAAHAYLQLTRTTSGRRVLIFYGARTTMPPYCCPGRVYIWLPKICAIY